MTMKLQIVGLFLAVVLAPAMAAGNMNWGHIVQTQHYDGKIYFNLDLDINGDAVGDAIYCDDSDSNRRIIAMLITAYTNQDQIFVEGVQWNATVGAGNVNVSAMPRIKFKH